MNPRLTLTAAGAVILASFSVYPLIQGWGWFWAGVGAVLTVAAAGTLTRLPGWPAAAGAGLLAVIACGPLLASPLWYAKAGGVLIVALSAASLTRVRVLPALACLITYLAALLIYLNAALAAGRSVAGFVPTRASLHYLWSQASGGLSERAYAPPVPGTHGIVLLAAAGIGVMAVAADLLAVRLRSPAIAGLPLLALYSVPITTNAKQGGVGATVVFCLGISGYLALLAADSRDRLRIWGRLVTVWQNKDKEAVQKPDTRALAASGRRIGLAAISVAILIPLLIPGIGVHGLFSGGASPGPDGRDRVQLPNPIAQMQQQLQAPSPQTVLTYTTDAVDPASQYLQVYVLNYNGLSGAWGLVPPGRSVSVGHGPLQPAPGVTARTPEITSHTRIRFASGVSGYGTKLSFLALPYAPASLAISGDWHQDKPTLMVYSTSAPLSGLTYNVTSRAAEPSAGEPAAPASGAAAAAIDNYLSPPPTHERQLLALANQITKGATTPFAKAVALERYFTGGNGFRYSLDTRVPNNTAGLVEFLTKTKRGFCQQFAIAMAVLARLAGIPSRIAVGYTAGANEGNGTWKVTTADAHAWPETLLRGGRLAPLRADPERRRRPGHRGRTGVCHLASAAGPGRAEPGPQRSRQHQRPQVVRRRHRQAEPPGHRSGGQGRIRTPPGRRLPVRAARRGGAGPGAHCAGDRPGSGAPQPVAPGDGQRRPGRCRLARADRRPDRLRDGLPAERIAARRGPQDRSGPGPRRPLSPGAGAHRPGRGTGPLRRRAGAVGHASR